jgi:hypothetical protein
MARPRLSQPEKRCTRCQIVKPIAEFCTYYHKKNDATYHVSRCKNCFAVAQKEFRASRPHYSRDWYRENPEKARANAKRYRSNNPEYSREWYQKNKESIREKQREYEAKNKEKIRRRSKDRYSRRRMEMIEAYGGACVCCGEATPEFLTIDHIYNDGQEHRLSLGNRTYAGAVTSHWLRKNNYPKDRFQLLCYNCNCAKGFYGECPHQKT